MYSATKATLIDFKEARTRLIQCSRTDFDASLDEFPGSFRFGDTLYTMRLQTGLRMDFLVCVVETLEGAAMEEHLRFRQGYAPICFYFSEYPEAIAAAFRNAQLLLAEREENLGSQNNDNSISPFLFMMSVILLAKEQKDKKKT